MLNKTHFVQIAGNSQKWDDEMQETKNLVKLQENQSARGYRPAKLVYSLYGWTVRYASGLQDNAILYKSGDFNPVKAIAWVKNWVEKDPEHREAYVSKYDIELCKEDGYEFPIVP